MRRLLNILKCGPILLSIAAASMFFAAARPARAQVSYTSAYLTDLNYNTQYPCGDPTQTTPTGQIKTNFSQAQFYGGGAVDWTCYQKDFEIDADIFSPITANILIWGGEHAVTVNANATIPSNFEICFGPGGSIAAGVGFTLTNNASACLGGGGGGGGLTEVGMQGDDTVFQLSVLNSPVTVSNQPGPLIPVLKVQPAGYALMGPRPAVPGAAAIIQYSVPQAFHDPSNVTSISLTGIHALTNDTNAGDRLILVMGCSGVNVNLGTPTIADSQGNSWPGFINSGPDGQALSDAIVGGPLTSITATLSYGAGDYCSDLVAWVVEVTNVTGIIDNEVDGRLIESGGTFANTGVFSSTSDLLIFQTETNQTVAPTAGNGPPPINQDSSYGDATFGQAKFGDSFTTGPGSYGASVTVVGGSGSGASFYMVGYETGGTFDLSAKPTFRPVTCGDLGIAVASYVCSPFIVLNDQSNTYTSSSETQDFSLSTHLFLPIASGATANFNGEIKYDTSANQFHAYVAGGDAVMLTTPSSMAASNNDCAKFNTAGGLYQIVSAGAPCGSGGGGNTTSTSLVTNNLPIANGANSIIDSGLTYTASVLTVPGLADSALTPGNCVQAATGGLLTTTGSACGSSGGSVTTTGSPANGQYTEFSGASSITTATAGENSVLAGPASGGAGAVTAQTAPIFSAANLTSFPVFNQSTTGNAATASASDHSPTGCPGGEFATGISTTWALTCTTPAGGGNVSNSGSPTAHELAVWVTSTTIEGVGGSSSNTVLHWNPGSDPTFSQVATADIATNAVTSAKMTIVNTRRTCDIAIGDESASALLSAQLGPQSRICFLPFAATIVELDVNADAGTPSVIVGLNHAGTISNIVSSALSTAASGGIACSNTTGSTGINGATTCSSTLQNTSVAAGDYLQLVSGTAGGTAKLFVAHVTYTIN